MVNLDRAAIGISILCILHCGLIPISLILVPTVASQLLHSQTWVHWVLLGVAIPFTLIALWRGYRQHQQRTAFVLGVVGLATMTMGVSHLFGLTYEIPLTLIGVSLVIAAHLINLKTSFLKQDQ